MPEQARHAEPAPRIGHLLHQGGCLTGEQLQQALDEQARGGEAPLSLGEICVRHGWCSRHDIAAALCRQHEAVFRDTTLGHLLLAQGRLTLDELEDALNVQAELDAPLGQILVGRGACTPDQVHAAMELQTSRRAAVLRHLTAADFSTFNVTEIIVNQELDGLLREEGGCTCDECRANVLAIALNSIPPRYVSDLRLLLLFVERFRAESLDLIRERIRLAVRRVREKPHTACRSQRPARGARAGSGHPVPVRLIERHAHLSAEDIAALFGEGHELTQWREASQPGHFVARETVQVVGPEGSLERVRVIGPPVGDTRVEVTGPDLFLLGQSVVALRGPCGTVQRGPILRRIEEHVHLSSADAAALGIEGASRVGVCLRGLDTQVIQGVALAIADEACLELHVPADEGVAGGLRPGASAEMLVDPEGDA